MALNDDQPGIRFRGETVYEKLNSAQLLRFSNNSKVSGCEVRLILFDKFVNNYF